MRPKHWAPEGGRTLICVDSYHQGVPAGRFFNAYMEEEHFGSLSQFLLKMQAFLEDSQSPQSYTTPRTFTSVTHPEVSGPPVNIRKGLCGTFDLKILFRQHTSWQGVIEWKERGLEQSFRSVLEMILLIDSALRSAEGSDSGSAA